VDKPEQPACEVDPEDRAWMLAHNLEVRVDATGHPKSIVCSCGHEFVVEWAGGSDAEDYD
jgi:hypothetical protein